MTSDTNDGVCLIRRVVIRNYKSIAACDVELGPLTFLVGPNGSGKSNFLDAIRFVSDSLRYSLDHALRDRRGITGVLRQGPDDPLHLTIRLDFQLTSGVNGHYAFRLGSDGGPFSILDEECFVSATSENDAQFYHVSEGSVRQSTLPVTPAATQDRLYLVSLSGTPAFRPIYDALSMVEIYNPDPSVIQDFQIPGSRDLLARDGSNLTGVLRALEEGSPEIKSRIDDYLTQIVPQIDEVEVIDLAHSQFETLMFWHRLADGERWPFMANQVSDGTLRATGILGALFQRGADANNGPLLIGLEEPETALHPAAAAVLIDAVRDALSMRQVLVTSHSPELLDNASIADSEILGVVAEQGITRIGRLNDAGRSVLKDHLFTAGDLLRMDQLRPETPTARLDPESAILFGTGAPA
jgi:predicted ATPase